MTKEGSKININQALIRTFIRLLLWELTHIIILVPKPWWSIEEPENQYLIYIPKENMLQDGDGFERCVFNKTYV
jgi:hypothetical protein